MSHVLNITFLKTLSECRSPDLLATPPKTFLPTRFQAPRALARAGPMRSLQPPRSDPGASSSARLSPGERGRGRGGFWAKPDGSTDVQLAGLAAWQCLQNPIHVNGCLSLGNHLQSHCQCPQPVFHLDLAATPLEPTLRKDVMVSPTQSTDLEGLANPPSDLHGHFPKTTATSPLPHLHVELHAERPRLLSPMGTLNSHP